MPFGSDPLGGAAFGGSGSGSLAGAISIDIEIFEHPGLLGSVDVDVELSASQFLTGLETWFQDASQQFNVDIELMGVLMGPPALIPPPRIYGS